MSKITSSLSAKPYTTLPAVDKAGSRAVIKSSFQAKIECSWKNKVKDAVNRCWQALVSALQAIFCCKRKKKSEVISSSNALKKETLPSLSNISLPTKKDLPPKPTKELSCALPAQSPKKPNLTGTRLPLQELINVIAEEPTSLEVRDEGKSSLKKDPQGIIKIPSQVLTAHFTPFLDKASVINLAKASRALSQAIPKTQKILYFPEQLAFITNENKHRLVNVDQLCIFYDNVTDAQLNALANKIEQGFFPNVKSIKIEREKGEVGTGRYPHIEQGLAALIRSLPKLEKISQVEVVDSSFIMYGKDVLSALKSKGKNLKGLEIQFEFSLHDMMIFWPNLEILRNSSPLGRKGFAKILTENCPHIKSLDLSHEWIDASELRIIAKSYPALQSLMFDAAYTITPAVLKMFPKGCFRKLALNEELSAEDLIDLLKDHPLEKLNLGVSHGINTPVILTQPHGLKYLRVNFHNNFTDERWLPLIAQLPELETLHLIGIPFVSDELLRTIAKHCPRFKTLMIITDQGRMIREKDLRAFCEREKKAESSDVKKASG